MAKEGIKLDYDLKANEHIKDKDVCVVCDNKLRCRWTDKHGEGVCMICGTPYQLMHGTDKQEEEGKYPYLRIKIEWLPILKEYWSATQQFVFHGISFSEETGRKDFGDWVKEKHPEMLEE